MTMTTKMQNVINDRKIIQQFINKKDICEIKNTERNNGKEVWQCQVSNGSKCRCMVFGITHDFCHGDDISDDPQKRNYYTYVHDNNIDCCVIQMKMKFKTGKGVVIIIEDTIPSCCIVGSSIDHWMPSIYWKWSVVFRCIQTHVFGQFLQ